MTNFTNANARYGADVVIERRLAPNQFAIWRDGDVIASVDSVGRDMIVAGASALKLSVFDASNQKWLAGCVGQLVEG